MKLPSFSFKKYNQTKEYEIDNIKQLFDKLTNIISQSLGKINDSQVLLLVIEIYHEDNTYELRIWIDQENFFILTNLPKELDPSKIYKIVVEEFEVTPIVAYYDIEKSIHLGHNIIKVDRTDFEAFKNTLTELLNITTTAPGTNVHITYTSPRMEKTPTHIKDELLLDECIKRITQICSQTPCPIIINNPLNALERYGITIMGSQSNYICIIRNSAKSNCKYLYLELQGNKLKHICKDDLSQLIQLFEEKRDQYDPLIY